MCSKKFPLRASRYINPPILPSFLFVFLAYRISPIRFDLDFLSRSSRKNIIRCVVSILARLLRANQECVLESRRRHYLSCKEWIECWFELLIGHYNNDADSIRQSTFPGTSTLGSPQLPTLFAVAPTRNGYLHGFGPISNFGKQTNKKVRDDAPFHLLIIIMIIIIHP